MVLPRIELGSPELRVQSANNYTIEPVIYNNARPLVFSSVPHNMLKSENLTFKFNISLYPLLFVIQHRTYEHYRYLFQKDILLFE